MRWPGQRLRELEARITRLENDVYGLMLDANFEKLQELMDEVSLLR